MSTQNPYRAEYVYLYISFCYISFNYLFLSSTSFAVFIAVSLSIFSPRFYVPSVFSFSVFIFFVHAVKIFQLRIIQFCYLSHGFPLFWRCLLSLFNCHLSLLHLLWYLFLLLSVSLSPRWSLSRIYTFYIFTFFENWECHPVWFCSLVPKFWN